METEKSSKKALTLAVITYIIFVGLILLFTNILLPKIFDDRAGKEQTCKSLCKEANLTYKELDFDMKCLCQDKERFIYTLGTINDNNTLTPAETLIMNNTDGTKFTCSINKTTKKFLCKNIE